MMPSDYRATLGLSGLGYDRAPAKVLEEASMSATFSAPAMRSVTRSWTFASCAILKSFRPELRGVSSVDKMRVDAQGIHDSAHAALQA